MSEKIRAGIVGYGNLGKSVEQALSETNDFETVGIFSRRPTLDTDTPTYSREQLSEFQGKIDLLFLCLGSATDIPEQGPQLARMFTTVDTYDNHALIPQHRARMDEAARAGDNLAMVSTGWDPGLFSLNRVYGAALYPKNVSQSTFWGPGLSQGHSDAIRRVPGVRAGVQYTVPNEQALNLAREGEQVDKTKAHTRQCYVVADETDHERIRREIVNMPDYFADYETTVEFVSQEVFDRDHKNLPHGGHVVSTGKIAGSNHTVEYALELECNPDFTAGSMVAFGRAAARLHAQGQRGARTVLEVAPYLLSPVSLDDLIERNV
jgi:diaminopimelate dehydrogenase